MSHRPGHRPLRFIVVAALLLSIASGCAAPELVWQQVDDMLLGRADDWLDLEAPQEQRLQARLDTWLREVRRERLTAYARFLRDLADRIEPDIDLADAHWLGDRFESLYADTMESFLPVITPTLAGLSPEQQRHLADRIGERNREYHARYVEGRDDGIYAIAERVIEAVERWTGTLEPAQRELVHEGVREWPRTAPGWYRWRRRMQQLLLTRIESGAGEQQIERTLRRWWIERGENVPGVRTGEFRDGLLRTLVALGRSLSAGQRAEARRRMRARADNLQTLADSAG